MSSSGGTGRAFGGRALRVVQPAQEGLRVDRYLAEVMQLFPRSQIPHRQVAVRVNERPAKLSQRVRAGDELVVEYEHPDATTVLPERIQLSILYEDDQVIVVDKPAGMVVHPAAGNWSGTLVNALLYHIRSLDAGFDDPLRPGIVHRLDRETSGVIIAAKNAAALEWLSRQFRGRTTRKHYLAVTRGAPRVVAGVIETGIGRDTKNRKRFAVVEGGGKPAVTEYRVLSRAGGYALVSLYPRTGRTHQLRVHLAHLGCPILGDPVYARADSRFPNPGLMLHAFELEIAIPGETAPRRFTAPLPERFRRVFESVAGPLWETSVSPLPRSSEGRRTAE